MDRKKRAMAPMHPQGLSPDHHKHAQICIRMCDKRYIHTLTTPSPLVVYLFLFIRSLAVMVRASFRSLPYACCVGRAGRHGCSYVDCATNSVRQTVAMAHPNIPASELYKMVRSIEEKITLRAADWFKYKTLPT